MPNNRMYARCRACGDTYYLARFARTSWWCPDVTGIGPSWNRWLDQHGEHAFVELGARGDWFVLAYENAQDPGERLEFKPAEGWPTE
ncbi:hypothetical protein AB0395_07495 [Streptosporangium sp. NPDC051023]|uniref:hypothetical protein n=1 Tax=Streptosporangium sp. NPDC051023 TaxID=3155410 RepID=UPI00344F8AE1